MSRQPLPPARKISVCHPPGKLRGEGFETEPILGDGSGLQGQELGPGFSFLSLCTAPSPLALLPASSSSASFLTLPHEASLDHLYLFLLPFLLPAVLFPTLSPKIWAMSPPKVSFLFPQSHASWRWQVSAWLLSSACCVSGFT